MADAEPTWLPLESNPECMNHLIEKMGVPSEWKIVDVFGLDPEVLDWVPKPTLAVIFLYPLNENTENFSKLQDDSATKKEVSKNVFFMKQYVHNACGTIALIHSVCNNLNSITLNDGPFKKTVEESKDLSPEERGKLLLKADYIKEGHQEVAMEGQTQAEPDKVFHHFVAYVNVDDELYELDGRKDAPINYGKTSSETFVQDAAAVIKKYISADENEVLFALAALVKADD